MRLPTRFPETRGTGTCGFALFHPRTQRKRREAVMPDVENNRVVETPAEARAGVTGHNVRYVLAAGTIGVAVLFAIVYVYFFA
jgi:hypothetical protein